MGSMTRPTYGDLEEPLRVSILYARQLWTVMAIASHYREYENGRDPDAARLAAAEAVWPELPADVRAKLGERP